MVVTDVSQLAIHLLRGGLCPLTFSQVADAGARVKGKKVESPFAKMKNILSTVSFAAACYLAFPTLVQIHLHTERCPTV